MTNKSPTAAVLIIGNEILSGSTQDLNVAFLGKRLALRGIVLREVRIVRDEEDAIVSAVNALRSAHTYVFTTGGIGPTHDDITAESVAKAFGVKCEIHPEARRLMEEGYKKIGGEMNDARLRMARIPPGGELIICDATIVPSFFIGNVYVLAGVPKYMQAQFLSVEDTLARGDAVLSFAVRCNQREGDIAFALEDIQNRFKNVDIGSYPHYGQTPALSFILRSTDKSALEEAVKNVAEMVRERGEEPLLQAQS